MAGTSEATRETREAMLTCRCGHLAVEITDTQMESVLATGRTHKSHPLRLLLDAASDLEGPAAAVLFNTDRAIRLIPSATDTRFATWLHRRITDAAGSNFERSASALGEIRAAGALIEAGASCLPLPEGTAPAPDFQIGFGGSTIFVEVHTKQMNAEESKRLAGFLHGGQGRSWSNCGTVVREHVVHPAGRPKDPETLGENVASKFASIKPRAHQAQTNRANVLWIDLQDEDCTGFFPESVLPVMISDDGFCSIGLWHAFYGLPDTPIFEHHAIGPGLRQDVRSMKFPGMFAQTTAWAAVVLSFPRYTVVFEHPNPGVRLPAATWPMVLRLPALRLHLSLIDWPSLNGSIQVSVQQIRETLVRIADFVRFE